MEIDVFVDHMIDFTRLTYDLEDIKLSTPNINVIKSSVIADEKFKKKMKK